MKSNYLNLVIWLLGGSLAVSITLGEEQADVSELNAKFQRLYATKQFNQAAPIAEKILQITEETRGPEDRKTAVAANNLAEVYRYMGQYAKAEPLYERALKVFEKELGPEHPDVASVLNNIALLDSEMGAYDKAETLYQRVENQRSRFRSG
jgi:tetratricopeptide (TPR) repeat protein